MAPPTPRVVVEAALGQLVRGTPGSKEHHGCCTRGPRTGESAPRSGSTSPAHAPAHARDRPREHRGIGRSHPDLVIHGEPVTALLLRAGTFRAHISGCPGHDDQVFSVVGLMALSRPARPGPRLRARR